MAHFVDPDLVVQKNSGERFCSSSVRILNDILALVVFPKSAKTQFEQSGSGEVTRAGIIDKSCLTGYKPANSCVQNPVNNVQHDRAGAMQQQSVDLDFNLEEAMTKLFGANYQYTSPANNLAASDVDISKDAINYPHWYSFASLFSGRVSNMQYQRAKVAKNIINKI